MPRPNPPVIELYYYANVFFCFFLKNMAVDHVRKNQQYFSHMVFLYKFVALGFTSS